MAHRLAALAIFIGLVTGCASASPPSSPSPRDTPTPVPSASPSAAPSQSPDAGGQLLVADVPRAVASTSDARAAADRINDFGLELLRRLAANDDNAVISPASIAIALGMARAGARGTTADEMDAVLRQVGTPENAAWLNALDRALAGRNQTFTDDAGTDREVILRVANTIFAQHDMRIEDAYLTALAQTYGAGVRLVDFIGAPEAAAQVANAWVDELTEGRIPELLRSDDVNDMTRFILLNAIYLKAPWAVPFPEATTVDGPFTRADGTTVQVPMMNTAQHLAFAEGSGWRAAELPYLGGALSMVLILPDDLAAFVADTDGALMAQIIGSLTSVRVELAMPRFSIETRVDLPEVLGAMGMPTAFTGAADFSGISTEERLLIQKVIHQANIDVDEEGTEAAAATAVIGGVTGGPPPASVQLRLDHPFLFALRDVETGAIIFLGQVGDPSV